MNTLDNLIYGALEVSLRTNVARVKPLGADLMHFEISQVEEIADALGALRKKSIDQLKHNLALGPNNPQSAEAYKILCELNLIAQRYGR